MIFPEGGALMNFQNLQYFLTVAEEGSMTRAAERLFVSQQALSNHITRLEEEVGCRLFTRKPNLELTYAGKYFQKSAARILDIQRQTATAMDDINGSRRGELRIGISYTRGQAILPLLLPDFHRAYPLVELSVVEGSTKELEASLSRGHIDVLIGFTPFLLESAVTRELAREQLFLVAPSALLQDAFGAGAGTVLDGFRENHDLRVFQELPFVLLKKGDRIRALVDGEFRSQGMEPAVCLETENIQTAFALAAEGMGLTVCPSTYLGSRYTISGQEGAYIRQQVEIAPFSGRGNRDVIAIGYNGDRYLPKIARDFIEMSVEKFRSL